MPTRRTLLRHATLAGLAAALDSPVRAEPTAPPEVLAAMPDARLIGSGRLRYFGLSVYDASLWAPPDFRATAFANQRFALSLTYLRTFSANEIAQRTLQEIRRVHDVSPDLARVWLTALQNVLPDVVAGDRITGLHPPGGVAFWQKERKLGDMGDAAFGSRFFGIWLADSTSEPGLRKALLARASP
jgi:hypothetical protein